MITAAKRASLPKSKFGLPAQEKYPVDTAARARNAKARAAQQVGKSITPAQKAQIDRKANPVITKAGGNPAPVKGSSAPMPKAKKNPLHKNPKPMGATGQMNKFFSS